MEWQSTVWADPLFLSTVLSGSMATFALAYYLRVRRERQVLAFVVLTLGTAAWTLGASFRLASVGLPAKLLWYRVQLVGQAVTPLALLVFTAEYADAEGWLTPRRLGGLSVIPAATTALAVAGNPSGLLWRGAAVTEVADIAVLRQSLGPWGFVHAGFSYLAVAVGVVFVLRYVARARRAYRGQAIALFVGIAAPTGTHLATVAGAGPTSVDLTAASFVVTGAAFGVAIFRYHLLNLVPVARDTAVEHMRDGFVVVDGDGRIVDINPAVTDVLSETDGDPLGELVGEQFPKLGAVVDRPDETVTREVTVDGAQCLELTASPLEGGSDGQLVLVRDVSERRRIERRYQVLIEEASDLIVVVDESGRITYVSPSIERVLGYPPEAAVGSGTVDGVVPEDRDEVGEYLDRLLETDVDRARFEYRTRRADGAVRTMDAIARDLRNTGAVDGIVVNARDITDRKEQERELRRTNERLEEFASLVSHDLRNPLNVAEGHVELLSETVDNESIHVVGDELERMRTIIEDMLTMARQGTSVDERDPVELDRAVRTAWENVDTADATLSIVCDLLVSADRTRLLTLLENCVRNAVEHAGEDVAVTVGPIPGEDDAAVPRGFYVADDGPGIPAENRDDVFESGVTTAADGTGFGLAIVADVAEAHGWSVGVTASDVGGARFEFRSEEHPVVLTGDRPSDATEDHRRTGVE